MASFPCRLEVSFPCRLEVSFSCRLEASFPCRLEASFPCRLETSFPCGLGVQNGTARDHSMHSVCYCPHSRKHDDSAAASSKLPKPGPVADKRVAAVQYYLSKARYSPLTSGNRRGREGEGALRQPSKVGFGSAAPRWPAENPRHNPPLLRQDSRESARLRPQPLFSGSKPLLSGSKTLLSGPKPNFSYLPSLATKGSGIIAGGKKDVLPSVGDFGPPREAPWKPVLQQRPTVVSGTTYHSNLASSQRHNVHGRTNWAAK